MTMSDEWPLLLPMVVTNHMANLAKDAHRRLSQIVQIKVAFIINCAISTVTTRYQPSSGSLCAAIAEPVA
jgi:hypothetical protein